MCSPKMLRLGSASESETKKHEYSRNLAWAAVENKFVQPEFPEFGLHGLNETVYWSQLDRWDYSGEEPVPPPYSIYTLLSLKHTFLAGAALLAIHFLARWGRLLSLLDPGIKVV